MPIDFNHIDPMRLAKLCWPDIHFYKEQVDIIYSVRDNDETFVPAGNMLGKDFVAGFISLWFFLSRTPSRVVTTSVDGTQLEGVLWGEIRRFIQTSRYALNSERDGPLLVNHLHLRKLVNKQVDGLSYCIGRVAAKGEGMLGHHIAKKRSKDAFTLFIADEASGVDDVSYERAETWAHRKLIIGNPFPCTNFFFRGVKAGNLKAKTNNHFLRKVIKIRGQDSPNVRMGMARARLSEPLPEEMLVPGVISYPDYMKRRAMWDEKLQTVGLDAEFYEGAEVRLYPPVWLANAAQFCNGPNGSRKTLGIDPAEGGDSSVWSICDSGGLLYQMGLKTPDTTVIPARTIALMQEWVIKPEDVFFDRGGGGKEHADALRRDGYNVNTVAFGESAVSTERFVRRMRTKAERVEEDEVKYTYKNRRSQMYHLLRLKINPVNEEPFGIPAQYGELVRQMGLFPLMYDKEGRLMLPPKNKNTENSTELTLKDMMGCSPDESDSLVLAVFGQLYRPKQIVAGVGF